MNLVDFDTEWGHRRDVPGFAACLEAFDRRLAEIEAAMRPSDYLPDHRRPRQRPDLQRASTTPASTCRSSPSARARRPGRSARARASPTSPRRSPQSSACRRGRTGKPGRHELFARPAAVAGHEFRRRPAALPRALDERLALAVADPRSAPRRPCRTDRSRRGGPRATDRRGGAGGGLAEERTPRRTRSMSARSATSCGNCTCMWSRATPATPPGPVRCGALARRSLTPTLKRRR